ncbi:MAG: hypothetical protein OHK0023_16100 [Anaerolineae bacterium]
MSVISIDDGLVHYEVLGRGRPVILLHGWLGSWRYWVPAMQHLSGKYRAYALDLWGFGDSGKDNRRYGITEQVTMLHNFFEKMGIPKAVLVGHSLGAAVALGFARRFPERSHRLMLISPPLVDVGGLELEITMNAVSASRPTPMPATPVTAAPPPPSLNTPAPVGNSIAAPSNPNNPNPPPTPPANPPGAASLPAQAASNEAPQPAVQFSTTAETLMANPFRSQLPPTEPRPTGPLLPTSIANVSPLTAPSSSVVPPSMSSGITNLLSAFLGAKPSALLAKHAARTMPDLEPLRLEVEKIDEAALTQTIQTLSALNLALELKRLMIPTLVLYGDNDALLPPASETLISRINSGKQNGYLISLIAPDAGHFPMLEISAKFNRLMLDFLEATDLTNIQFKDQWKRTLR